MSVTTTAGRAALALAAAATVLATAACGGSGGSGAPSGSGGSGSSDSTGSGGAATSGTSSHVTAPGPTDIALPHNAGAYGCKVGTSADLVVSTLQTELAFLHKGQTGGGYPAQVVQDCTSPAVFAKIKALYGQQFYFYAGPDTTGGKGVGPVAMYTLHLQDSGHQIATTITWTLVKQTDGHYIVTAYRLSS